MKRWYGGVVVASLFALLVLRYGLMKDPIGEGFFASPYLNTTNPLEWVRTGIPSAQSRDTTMQVVSTDNFVSSLFIQKRLTSEEQRSLQAWKYLNNLLGHSRVLPNAIEAFKEAGVAWDSLMASVQEQSHTSVNGSSRQKQCPYFLNKMNATEFGNSGYKLQIPCGLIQGSSVTIIGIPNGLLGNFRIDLSGAPLPGEPDPPIILHYNVRLHGDKITEEPVVVQNTWTVAHDWGEEERCPSPDLKTDKKGMYCADYLFRTLVICFIVKPGKLMF